MFHSYQSSPLPVDSNTKVAASLIGTANIESADSLSPSRIESFNRLQTRQWFRESSEEIKLQLLSLPSSFDELIKDLSNRPEQIGNITQVNLNNLFVGKFGALIQYNVTNQEGRPFTYEYFSWGKGANPGSIGIVFLVDKNTHNVTHLVLQEVKSFATTEIAYNGFGGFKKDDETNADTAIREIAEELGCQEDQLELAKLVDSGKFTVDMGLTSNTPSSFVAYLNVDPTTLTLAAQGNADEFEAAGKIKLIPISKLSEFIRDTSIKNSFISHCLLHTLAQSGSGLVEKMLKTATEENPST